MSDRSDIRIALEIAQEQRRYWMHRGYHYKERQLKELGLTDICKRAAGKRGAIMAAALAAEWLKLKNL